MRIRSGEEIEDGLCPDSASIWSEPQLLKKSQPRINTTDLPMADKKVFLPQVEEFAGEDSAPKTKAPTTGLDGCAAKRKVQYGYACSKGEQTADEQATTDKTKGLSEVTMATEMTMEQQDDSNLDKFYEEWKAEYAQLMDELFGNGPNATPVRWVKHPSFMYYDGQDDEKEEEELGVV
jgi:hypothetical protein